MKEIKTDKDIKQVANEIIRAYGKQVRKNRERTTNNARGD